MHCIKRINVKIISLTMSCFMIYSSTLVSPNNRVFAVNSSLVSQSHTKKSWSESHPILIKFLKYVAIGAGVIGAASLSYYAGRLVLDITNPDRVTSREDIQKVKVRLKQIDKQLLNYELGESSEITKDNLDEMRKIKSSLESRVNINKSNFSATDTIAGLAGLGGAITIAKCGMDIINSLGEFSKNILNISNLRWSGSNFVNMYKETSELLKPPPRGMQKEDALDYFNVLFEDFYGQDEAVTELKSHIFDIIIAKDQAKWNGEKYSHCDVLYLYGPSGVGKSFIAKRLPKALLSAGEPLILSSSDVNKEKKESVVDQLFNSVAQNSEKIIPTKPLIKYLKNNPGGVIIFEEYDKICTPALDEVIRGAIDQGIINIDGEKVDCSGTTFIFTSNEDDISMNGFDENSDLSLSKENLEAGYTRVAHSKSFLNRIKKVKFKNLTSPEYASIIKSHFNMVNAYWKNPNNGGINLVIEEKIIQKLSVEVEKINQGARPIDLWIIPQIQILLGDKIKNAPNYNFYNGKTLNIKYDENNRVFSVNEE